MTDPFDNGYWVKADFARDLERRLAAATARAEEAWTKEVQTYYEKLEARYGRILYRLGIDPNNDPEKHVADLRAELDRLRKEREELEAAFRDENAKRVALERGPIMRVAPTVPDAPKQEGGV